MRVGAVTLQKTAVVLAVAVIGLSQMGIECSESARLEFGTQPLPHYAVPYWSPDGSRIIIDMGYRGISIVEADGSRLQTVLGEGGRYDMDQSFDLSPDGTRVVYTTYRHKIGFPFGTRNFEIATVALDGSDHQRLTKHEAVDAKPVWSPDGTRIAFLSYRLPGGNHLFTMASDGSDVRSLASTIYARDARPVWSPDGRRLAFLALEEAPAVEGRAQPRRTVIYTVASDGSDLTRISETTSRPAMSQPAWSPDSGSIAFFKDTDDGVRILYSVNPDGSGLRELVRVKTPMYGRSSGGSWQQTLYWSPDGSEIRSGAYPFFTVKVDGSDLRVLTSLQPEKANATWSPDGSRVAVHIKHKSHDAPDEDRAVQPFTMAPDGSDKRVLAKVVGGRLAAGHGNLWSPIYDWVQSATPTPTSSQSPEPTAGSLQR